MKTYKNKDSKTVAVIRNSHNFKEMEEMGEQFVNSKSPLLNIEQIIELERKKHLQLV
jgi:hypothetical protein